MIGHARARVPDRISGNVNRIPALRQVISKRMVAAHHAIWHAGSSGKGAGGGPCTGELDGIRHEVMEKTLKESGNALKTHRHRNIQRCALDRNDSGARSSPAPYSASAFRCRHKWAHTQVRMEATKPRFRWTLPIHQFHLPGHPVSG